MKPAPIRIEPTFSPRLWGSRSLTPLYSEKTNLPEPIGEAWLTGVDCRIASGHFAGKTLGEMWREMPPEWRGELFAGKKDFPLLAKFIFPQDKLSIQVHPDDNYAAVHETDAGGQGKTEMWHAVSAEAGANVFVGLKPGIDKEKFAAAIASHTVEELLQSHTVHAGDTFFIPAGTPHTIGAGMVLCEVQQYSDLTYRVYDYGRVDPQGKSRELHIEKALDVIKFEGTDGSKVASFVRTQHPEQKLLAACRYFAAEKWKFALPWETASNPRHFELLIILSGGGRLRWEGQESEYRQGECWFIPTTLGTFSAEPNEVTTLLRSYVPDLGALHREFQNNGCDEKTIAGVLFD